MIDQRFGKWTVIANSEHTNFVKCKCDCGKQQEVRKTNLRLGRSTQCRSCAGRLKAKNAKTLVEIKPGDKLGKWTVLCDTESLKDQRRAMLCKCECGKESSIAVYALRSGRSNQCEICANGFERKKTRHWRGEIPEFVNWRAMVDRCYRKTHTSYDDYGGRGITVCDEWRSPKEGFRKFLEDMGSKPSSDHTIDRIDNDKGYYKDNCRWSTQKEQCNNKRQSER